jgi:tetratricopeptide (TPR) repeat protein
MKNQEKSAETLRDKAVNIERKDPRAAIGLLITAIKKYPKTWTVVNLVLDDVIRIGTTNGFWDEAIFACQKAQILKKEYKKSYVIEERACRLEKNGDFYEATLLRYKRALEPGPFYEGKRKDFVPLYTDLRRFGEKFAELNANDTAWRVYNEAATSAARIGQSPHTVRQAMAKLLLKENKPINAVEILISGMCEANKWAKKGIPKSLIADLKRAIKASGIEDNNLAEEIAKVCKSKGRNSAIDMFYKSGTKKK